MIPWDNKTMGSVSRGEVTLEFRAFIDSIQRGDYVSWVSFDGSSVYKVLKRTKAGFVLMNQFSDRTTLYPTTGHSESASYGGFIGHLSPAGADSVTYFEKARLGRIVQENIKGFDLDQVMALDKAVRRIHKAKRPVSQEGS
jgi:hypothetical protein